MQIASAFLLPMNMTTAFQVMLDDYDEITKKAFIIKDLVAAGFGVKTVRR
jgi:hypothetical protein